MTLLKVKRGHLETAILILQNFYVFYYGYAKSILKHNFELPSWFKRWAQWCSCWRVHILVWALLQDNRPFYSCVWKRDWGWPCFDINLSALLCKSSYSYANYYFSRTISKTRSPSASLPSITVKWPIVVIRLSRTCSIIYAFCLTCF